MAFNWLKIIPGIGRVANAGDPAGDHNAMSEALTETRTNVDTLDNTKASISHTHNTSQITAGILSIERVAAGSTITVDYYKPTFGSTANAWPTVRPTSRTDITIIAKGPGVIDVTQPPLSWMIDGDDWNREA